MLFTKYAYNFHCLLEILLFRCYYKVITKSIKGGTNENINKGPLRIALNA